MEETGPIDVITRLVTALNACDLESATNLLESGASFVMNSSVVAHQTSGMHQALGGSWH